MTSESSDFADNVTSRRKSDAYAAGPETGASADARGHSACTRARNAVVDSGAAHR
ncbi:hypothetical protein RSUY_01020 [Ralstonia solanacearum]|nr:hypothetical protein RSUY_01020 [Ralstonia solanacearum]